MRALRPVVPLLALLLASTAAPAGAAPRDDRTFGVGFSGVHMVSPTPTPMAELPAFLSARLLLPRLQLGGLLGVARADNFFQFVPGVRANLVLHQTDDTSLYVAGQLAVAFTSGGPRSLFALLFAGPGVEFRLPGLRPLAFFLDAGLAAFIGDSLHFSTSGSLLGSAGFHYYF